MKNWKYLLLIIPAIVLICACLIIDIPIAQEKQIEEQEAAKQALKEENQKSSQEKLTLDLIVGTVGSAEDGGSAKIYESPDDTSEELTKLQFNCAVIENQEEGLNDWYRVNVSDTEVGYVKEAEAERVKLEIGSENDIRDEVVKNAVKYIGVPFVRYGSSLKNGIDCANFVQQIFMMSDIYLPDTAYNIGQEGIRVSDGKLQPGDLIYYDEANDGTGHVGIYLGNDFIINSSGHSGKTYPRGGVRICRRIYYDRTSYYGIDVID